MPVPRQTSRARYPGSRPIGQPPRVGEQRAQYPRCFGSGGELTDFPCRFEQDAGMRANASANAASASGQPPSLIQTRALTPAPRHRAPKYAADRPLKPGGSTALGANTSGRNRADPFPENLPVQHDTVDRQRRRHQHQSFPPVRAACLATRGVRTARPPPFRRAVNPEGK